MVCPNCEAIMNEDETCLECDHTENGYCECPYCNEQRFPTLED